MDSGVFEIGLARLLAAEAFQPGTTLCSEALQKAIRANAPLCYPALISVAWKISDNFLAGVNIVRMSEAKTVIIQDVQSSLAGKALRASVGTVVFADSTDIRASDVTAAAKKWGIMRMMSTCLAYPAVSSNPIATLTIGFSTVDVPLLRVEDALKRLAKDMMNFMPLHIDSFLRDVQLFCPSLGPGGADVPASAHGQGPQVPLPQREELDRK
eukprot:jgi/Botrbrau1/730/Bobra.160_2s0053.1